MDASVTQELKIFTDEPPIAESLKTQAGHISPIPMIGSVADLTGPSSIINQSIKESASNF
jgi:hypothetical protein